ncbi:hypothetical protein KAH55_04875, partial [bacterium]|nr:hypothetical protein [bacterium]
FVDAGMIAEGLVSVDDLDGYWRSRCVDMATPFIWRNQLYCLAGGTSNRMRSATRGNRVYGFFKWDERTQAWIEDTRNPLIMNPLANTWHATDYDWCSDHMGGYPCFWADEQERYLYLFTSYTDGSDGYVVGYTFWDLLDVGLFG